MDAASLAGGEQALHDQKLHGLTRGDPCHAENLGHLEQIGQLYAQRQHAVFDLLAQHVRQLGVEGRTGATELRRFGKNGKGLPVLFDHEVPLPRPLSHTRPLGERKQEHFKVETL